MIGQAAGAEPQTADRTSAGTSGPCEVIVLSSDWLCLGCFFFFSGTEFNP